MSFEKGVAPDGSWRGVNSQRGQVFALAKDGIHVQYEWAGGTRREDLCGLICQLKEVCEQAKVLEERLAARSSDIQYVSERVGKLEMFAGPAALRQMDEMWKKEDGRVSGFDELKQRVERLEERRTDPAKAEVSDEHKVLDHGPGLRAGVLVLDATNYVVEIHVKHPGGIYTRDHVKTFDTHEEAMHYANIMVTPMDPRTYIVSVERREKWSGVK